MHKKLLIFVLTLAFALSAAVAMADEGKKPKFKEFHSIVDYEFVAKYAKVPRPKDSMILDSRPYKPTFIGGFIPGAVSQPIKTFDKTVAMLPENKDAVLVFYCGGFT